MLKNPAIVQEFPFMSAMAQKVAKQGGGCGGCGQKRVQNSADYEGIKTAIGSMSNAKKTRLAQLLNTKKFRVSFMNYKGQKVKQTFG